MALSSTSLVTHPGKASYIDWGDVRRRMDEAHANNPLLWIDLPRGTKRAKSNIAILVGLESSEFECRREPIGHRDDSQWNESPTNEIHSSWERRKIASEKNALAKKAGKRIWLRIKPPHIDDRTPEQVEGIFRYIEHLEKNAEYRQANLDDIARRRAEAERRAALTPGQRAIEEAMELPAHVRAKSLYKARLLRGQEIVDERAERRAKELAETVERLEFHKALADDPSIRRKAAEAHLARMRGEA